MKKIILFIIASVSFAGQVSIAQTTPKVVNCENNAAYQTIGTGHGKISTEKNKVLLYNELANAILEVDLTSGAIVKSFSFYANNVTEAQKGTLPLSAPLWYGINKKNDKVIAIVRVVRPVNCKDAGGETVLMDNEKNYSEVKTWDYKTGKQIKSFKLAGVFNSFVINNSINYNTEVELIGDTIIYPIKGKVAKVFNYNMGKDVMNDDKAVVSINFMELIKNAKDISYDISDDFSKIVVSNSDSMVYLIENGKKGFKIKKEFKVGFAPEQVKIWQGDSILVLRSTPENMLFATEGISTAELIIAKEKKPVTIKNYNTTNPKVSIMYATADNSGWYVSNGIDNNYYYGFSKKEFEDCNHQYDNNGVKPGKQLVTATDFIYYNCGNVIVKNRTDESEGTKYDITGKENFAIEKLCMEQTVEVEDPNSAETTFYGKIMIEKNKVMMPVSQNKVFMTNKEGHVENIGLSDKFGDFTIHSVRKNDKYTMELENANNKFNSTDVIHITKLTGESVGKFTLNKDNKLVFELNPGDYKNFEYIDKDGVTGKFNAFKSKSGKGEFKYAESVVFVKNSAKVTNYGKETLNKVAAIMSANPTTKLKINAYSDTRGNDDNNKTLTEMRAQAMMAYLVSKGVDAGKMTAQGMGESNVLNRCKNDVSCSEIEHRLNRRVEFVFTVE